MILKFVFLLLFISPGLTIQEGIHQDGTDINARQPIIPASFQPGSRSLRIIYPNQPLYDGHKFFRNGGYINNQYFNAIETRLAELPIKRRGELTTAYRILQPANIEVVQQTGRAQSFMNENKMHIVKDDKRKKDGIPNGDIHLMTKEIIPEAIKPDVTKGPTSNITNTKLDNFQKHPNKVVIISTQTNTFDEVHTTSKPVVNTTLIKTKPSKKPPIKKNKKKPQNQDFIDIIIDELF